MAKKGQKFRRYTPEFKEMILKEYFEGEGGYDTLARKYAIPWQTINGWIKKSQKGINIKVDHRPGHSGRVKRYDITLEDYKERYEILKKYQAFLEARQGKK